MGTDWMSQGKCKDMDPAFFFPSDGVGVKLAQAVCAGCPVQEPCLDYALSHRVQEGVWGGTSECQRKRILRRARATRTSRTAAETLESLEPAGRP